MWSALEQLEGAPTCRIHKLLVAFTSVCLLGGADDHPGRGFLHGGQYQRDAAGPSYWHAHPMLATLVGARGGSSPAACLQAIPLDEERSAVQVPTRLSRCCAFHTGILYSSMSCSCQGEVATPLSELQTPDQYYRYFITKPDLRHRLEAIRKIMLFPSELNRAKPCLAVSIPRSLPDLTLSFSGSWAVGCCGFLRHS